MPPRKNPPPRRAARFFDVQAARSPTFFSQSPLSVAAKEETEDGDDRPMERQEAVVQTKLTMGAPGDPYEREADAMADRVVQRMHVGEVRDAGAPSVQSKCSRCHDEEKVQREELQPKSDGSMEVPDSVQTALDGGRGGGQTIQPALRDEMESAFETDFSDVRIHTGSSAENLNQDLNARAFTHGTDVYFNSGEFRPETPQGRHLLAHELTHVVQQNSGLQRKPAKEPADAVALKATGGKKIQAQSDLWGFGPPHSKYPSGTLIHNEVLPLFVEKNPQLFIEVSIPGATRKDVDTGRVGVADFYKAGTGGRTIGIKYPGGEPKELGKNGRFESGRKSYDHDRDSAPQTGIGKHRVVNSDKASATITLGDLKPGNTAEAYDGRSQLNNYASGIHDTAKSQAAYLAANPGQANDSGKWDPSVGSMAPGDIKIPPQLKYPSGKGLSECELSVFEGNDNKDFNSGIKGAMYVYAHHVSGIWAYEWFPHKVPTVTAGPMVEKALKRLVSEVIDPVKKTGVSKAPPAIRRRAKAKLRRKEDKFPFTQWQTDYGKWKKDTEQTLAKPEDKKKANVAEALVGLDKRTGHQLNLPAATKEHGLGIGKIRHWLKYGKLYGWLRNTFDGLYVKVKTFADKVKNKVQGFLKKVSSGFTGDWFKAAVRVIFKIVKIVGSWAITQVLDKLVDSLREGINTNLNNLIDAITPEGVKSKIEEFEAKKAEYEALIAAKQEELEKRLFGDKLALLEEVEKWESRLSDITTIISLARWGMRLIACASPPAVGCLWNLLLEALQVAFAMLMQTCWFTKKVYAPVLNRVEEVRKFPATVASLVVVEANKLIPLPAGMTPLFAEIHLDNGDIKLDCDEGKDGAASLSPERRAILAMMEEIGEQKFNAMMEMMVKRGAGPWVLLTAERLAELKKLMQEVTVEELKKAAEQPKSDVPAPLQHFLAGISQYSKQEKALIRESDSRKAVEKGGPAEGAKKDTKPGSEGGGGGSTDFEPPMKTVPGAVDKGTVTPKFRAITRLPESLKAGSNYPQPIDIHLIVDVLTGPIQGSAFLYPVSVRVQSVSASEVVFVNLNTFYAYYSKPHFVKIDNDYLIHVKLPQLNNKPP